MPFLDEQNEETDFAGDFLEQRAERRVHAKRFGNGRRRITCSPITTR